jgi:hypothetical protein
VVKNGKRNHHDNSKKKKDKNKINQELIITKGL